MFNGWNLLRAGFVGILAKNLDRFRLLKLVQSSAYGAAKLAAKQEGVELPLSQTTKLLYLHGAPKTGYPASLQMNGYDQQEFIKCMDIVGSLERSSKSANIDSRIQT